MEIRENRKDLLQSILASHEINTEVKSMTGNNELKENTESNQTSPEISNTDIKDALDITGKKIDDMSAALLNGAKLLNEASERFSEKAPGQRSSILGYLLVISALFAEAFQGVAALGFEFRETMSVGMLIIGSILVLIGGGYDTYFNIRIADAQEKRASALEDAAKDTMKQAQQARTEGLSFLKKLVGK